MEFKMRELSEAFIELLRKEAGERQQELVNMRRHFHMYPETGYETHDTEKYIKERLNEAGIETIDAEYGIYGFIKGGSDEMIALRADMDALNLKEENDVPFRSKVEGKMHACGHDSHTAMLISAAKLINEHKDMLKYSVLFIFQPAEEGPGQGGAVKVCAELEERGLLHKIKCIFGLHISNDYPCGVLASKAGSLTASTNGFEIKINGKGGHAGYPHKSIDALSVAAKFVNNIESVMSRQIDPLCPAVFSIGVLRAGSAKNVIAESAVMEGTIRCGSPEVRREILRCAERTLKGTCAAFGAEGEISVSEGVAVLVNDKDAVDYAVKAARAAGSKIRITETPVMGAEDFAFFAEKIPAAFMWLGGRNEEKGYIKGMHSPYFDFDEEAMQTGVIQHCMTVFSLE